MSVSRLLLLLPRGNRPPNYILPSVFPIRGVTTSDAAFHSFCGEQKHAFRDEKQSQTRSWASSVSDPRFFTVNNACFFQVKISFFAQISLFPTGALVRIVLVVKRTERRPFRCQEVVRD